MKFTSLQEYFYKLHNVLYVFMLLPLLTFVYILLKTPQKPGWLEMDHVLIIVGLCIVIAGDWLMTIFFFNSMVIKASLQIGLGIKLDQYYVATIVRFALCSMACVIIVFGYFLTEHVIFTILFAGGLVLFFAYWPWPAKVCKDLKLRGDEKTMVLYKRMTF